MVEIVRGTTPTLVFTLPDTVDTGDMVAINFKIVQNEKWVKRENAADFSIFAFGQDHFYNGRAVFIHLFDFGGVCMDFAFGDVNAVAHLSDNF